MVIGAFRQMVEQLTSGVLIVEHKPDDEGHGSTAAVAVEFAGAIHSPQMIRCSAFFSAGYQTF